MMCVCCVLIGFFFFKQKTAYEMRISDWSSDVCSSDLARMKSSTQTAKILSPNSQGQPNQPASPGTASTRLSAMMSPSVQPLPQWAAALPEIGRASCRERGCQYV